MSTIDSTPLVVGRTLRILGNELLLLAEYTKYPLTPTVRAGIQRDLIEIRESLTRCADDLETGHT